jgi:alginate O-acetyltransferase complex protein AlgI
MLFNSWEFLILLVITVVLYYLPLTGNARRVWQITLLLVASAVFYAWEEPRLLLLLGFSCVANAVAVERILFWKTVGRTQPDPPTSPSSAGLVLHSAATKEAGSSNYDRVGQNPLRDQGSAVPQNALAAMRRESGRIEPSPPYQRAKRWLFWTVALNLAFLAFFKYAGFLAGLLPETPTTETLKDWFNGIPLPVGISFYTFQGISMVVDVWRDDISPKTRESLAARGNQRISSIRDTSFYIVFFPQLVAGPIVKAHEFVDQIGAKFFREIDWLTVRRGLILGYFLKVFVADNMSESTVRLSAGFDLEGGGPINLMSLLYGYSLQIFADFAGYSLIAIGLGALFGYKLPPNFNFPYLSMSITEFWRRWHLSLSSWLRDYLYIPLGGNRKGTGRTYFNLFLVMFLGGLWHGAAWKFAIWGSLHGLFLAAERLATRARYRRSKIGDGRSEINQKSTINNPSVVASAKSDHQSSIHPQSPISNLLISVFRWIITFHLVTLLWLTFMMPDMASIVSFFKGLARAHFGFSGPAIFSLAFYGSAVVLYHAWGWLREHRETFALKLLRSPIEPLVQGIMIFLVVTNPGAPRGFIYFQF